jgi:AcrR family transcriptional regulator
VPPKDQASDPDRVLALLWRRHHPLPERPTGPGRPPRLSVDALVRTAVRLADADGLAKLTMSRVAAALDVGTMTLYSYVRAKSELVELMVDEVLTDRALPGPGEPRPEPWREQVALYAERSLAMYRQHPWLRHVSTARPPAGPGTMAEREYVLSTLAGLGLAPVAQNLAALAISTFVRAAAMVEVEGEELERTSGQSGDAWWAARGALWEEYFDVERHPTMAMLWNTGGFVQDTCEQTAGARTYGLDRLLDGIEGRA